MSLSAGETRTVVAVAVVSLAVGVLIGYKMRDRSAKAGSK